MTDVAQEERGAVSDHSRDRALRRWIAVSPIVFLVHDAEEILTVHDYLLSVSPRLPEFARDLAPATADAFPWAIGLLFLVQCTVAIVALRARGSGPAAYIFALIVMARLTNVLVHVAHAVTARAYVPGIVTALLVVAPFGALLIARMLDARWIAWPAVHVLFFAGLIVQLAGGLALLGAGSLLARLFA